jgi:hypothetical protein
MCNSIHKNFERWRISSMSGKFVLLNGKKCPENLKCFWLIGGGDKKSSPGGGAFMLALARVAIHRYGQGTRIEGNRCNWGRERTYKYLKGSNSSLIEVPLRMERETDAISVFRSAWRGLLAPADAGSLHHYCLSGWLPTTESPSHRVRKPARGSPEGRLPPAATTATCK